MLKENLKGEQRKHLPISGKASIRTGTYGILKKNHVTTLPKATW